MDFVITEGIVEVGPSIAGSTFPSSRPTVPLCQIHVDEVKEDINKQNKRGWDKSPSLSIIFGLSSKTQWLSGLYYADFISWQPYSTVRSGTTKSNLTNYRFRRPTSLFLKSVRWFHGFDFSSSGVTRRVFWSV